MTVKPNKEVPRICICLYSIAFCSAILFYFALDSFVSSVLIFGICCALATRFWIAFGKTITFDSYGIRISWTIFRKSIHWNDVYSMGTFQCENTLGYKDVSVEGVEFMTSKKRRPAAISPSMYSMFYHPWSYIFLSYNEKVSQPKGVQYPLFYEVDKAGVAAFLKSINISIDG